MLHCGDYAECVVDKWVDSCCKAEDDETFSGTGGAGFAVSV